MNWKRSPTFKEHTEVPIEWLQICDLPQTYLHTLASFSPSSPSTPLINPTIA